VDLAQRKEALKGRSNDTGPAALDMAKEESRMDMAREDIRVVSGEAILCSSEVLDMGMDWP
jgi:hypothetical protein